MERCFLCQPTRSLWKLFQRGPWDRDRAPTAKAFKWIFSCEDASESSNIHHFSARTKC